ncbi:MAG: T9SS type A sorting domain-containing protein [Flavobacteriales bacterium]|nr:T9SS type A sorting domain-containing protein [Flavobacteriales bacterium]
MKKHYSLFILLILCCFGITESRASHAAGADLYYEHLGGNDYEVTAYFYRDCGGIAPPTSIGLSLTSANCQNDFFSLPPTGQEVILSAACNNQLTECNGGSAVGILKIEYQGIITLPSCVNGNDWELSWSVTARNSAITNNGGGTLYIEALLDHANSNGNSSPVFSNDPVAFVCIGQNFTFNHGAIDPDGDSLAYSFTDPLVSDNSPVSWFTGFSATNPLSSSTPITIDPVTGDMNFTPSAFEVAVMAVKVDEYRAGKWIGSTTRDMQIWVTSCNNNTLPDLSGINGTNSYATTVCAGNLVNFDVFASDADGDNLTVSWNNGISAGTFTPSNNNTPNAEGKFTWTPGIADISPNPHVFTVTVKDDACPSNGQQIFTYSVLVSGVASISGTVVDESCQGASDGSITLNLSNVTPPYSILWNTGDTTATLNNLPAGTYVVDVADSSGCNVVDTFVVAGSNTPCCNYQIIGEDSICPGNTTCVWLEAVQTVNNGIIGMNYCLSYDTTWFTPTGNATLGQVVYAALGQGNGETVQLNTTVPGQVYATIYFDSNTPAGTFWQGSGQVICIEFNVDANTPTGAYNFSACELEESYSISEVTQCAISGDVTALKNSALSGRIHYWDYDGLGSAPARPLMYDVNNPNDHLITTINATNGSGVWTHTDLNGEFSWDANDGNMVVIERDILGNYFDSAANCTDVFPFINGADAYLAALISNFDMNNQLDSNGSWIPNKYQMVAGDVNMNDRVRANDVTHIMSRSVRNICEFPQVWNYTLGTPANPAPDPTLGSSKDWRFMPSVDTSTTQTDAVIAEWTFENISGNVPALPIATSYQDAIVASAEANLLGGTNSGSPAVCSGNETWATNFWTTNSTADSAEYIEYSIQVSGDVALTSLTMDLSASSASSAYTYDLYYVLNGTQVYVATDMADTVSCGSHAYALTGLNLVAGDLITFRVYPYGQNSGAQTASLRMDNVVLNGSFTSSNGNNPADHVADANYPVYTASNATGGYWRDDVPNVPDTVSLFTIDSTATCPNYGNVAFDAVLLGDLTSSWDPTSSLGTGVRVSSAGTMNFDVRKIGANEYMMDVSYDYADSKSAIDFRLDYNESKITILDVQTEQAASDAGLIMEWNDFGAEKLYLTSYTLKAVDTKNVLYSVHFKANGNLNVSDLGSILPMINGEIVNASVTVPTVSGIDSYELAGYFELYPNPTTGIVNIEYALDHEGTVDLTISNVLGQTVFTTSLGNMSRLTTKTLDLSGFEKGVYNIKLSSENGEIVKKVILE